MLSFITPFGIEGDRKKFVWSIDKRAGKGNWIWAFKVGRNLYSYDLGMQLYEDAYWVYLRKHTDDLKAVINSYNIYVINRHDLDAGLSYKKQEHPYNEHHADIAIRRCLRRYGAWFKGRDLMSLKSLKLDDAHVPFHLPHLVNNPEKSIRSWFDSSRVIVVSKSIEDEAKLAEILIR